MSKLEEERKKANRRNAELRVQLKARDGELEVANAALFQANEDMDVLQNINIDCISTLNQKGNEVLWSQMLSGLLLVVLAGMLVFGGNDEGEKNINTAPMAAPYQIGSNLSGG